MITAINTCLKNKGFDFRVKKGNFTNRLGRPDPHACFIRPCQV